MMESLLRFYYWSTFECILVVQQDEGQETHVICCMRIKAHTSCIFGPADPLKHESVCL